MSYSVRWYFNLSKFKPTSSELSYLLSSIQSDERVRIERFVYKRDAYSSLIGRLLIRLYCCVSLKLNWKDVVLKRDTNNKPYFNSDVSFNVSHQGKYVIFTGELNNIKSCDNSGNMSNFKIVNNNFKTSDISNLNSDDISIDNSGDSSKISGISNFNSSVSNDIISDISNVKITGISNFDSGERTNVKTSDTFSLKSAGLSDFSSDDSSNVKTSDINLKTVGICGSNFGESSNVNSGDRNDKIINNKTFFSNNDESGERKCVKIGCDVMKQEYTGGKEVAEFFRLMKSNFSKYEWDLINSANDVSDKVKIFFRFWTLKESYVKAIGSGITIPLDKISFKINSNLLFDRFIYDTKLYVDNVKRRDWLFQEIQLDEDHCVAVAYYGDQREFGDKFTEVNYNDIMKYCQLINYIDYESGDIMLNKEYSP